VPGRASVAFLILAHRGPAQLGRLTRRLLSERTEAFLHIDRRTSARVHAEILAALPADARLRLLERVPTPWSRWGPVEATLRALDAILSASAARHVVLMSGQDYLLRPADAVVDFLADYEDRSFVASWPLPSPLYGRDGGMPRLLHWHAGAGRRRLRVPVRRRYPAGIRPYGGSAFMVLDRASVAAVLEFTRARPDVARFHRRAWAVDEHYIQTALHNSPRSEAAIDENLWHIEWEGAGAKHPRTFRAADAPRLIAAGLRSSDVRAAQHLELGRRLHAQTAFLRDREHARQGHHT
jgi:hypothetical protein